MKAITEDYRHVNKSEYHGNGERVGETISPPLVPPPNLWGPFQSTDGRLSQRRKLRAGRQLPGLET